MERAKVMVVDDDAAQRDGIAALLRAWGYKVETASDGVDALSKIPLFGPDLVISDLEMSPMNGLELLKELRCELRPIDCIIISGAASLSEELESIRLGAYGFLEKPIQAELLKVQIRNCLQVHRSQLYSAIPNAFAVHGSTLRHH